MVVTSEITKALSALAELVPFFPRGEMAQRVLAAEIRGFCGNQEQLQWFVTEYARRVPKYECIPQLRAVFCSRYPPADGIEPTMEVAGFTANDLEARYQERIAAETQQKLADYERRAAIEGKSEPVDIKTLAEVKKL